MSLHALPTESLQHIAFLLVAHTPLGPPAALLPLRLTSKHIHAALDSPALHARIFRLKFDAGAVTRRLFAPHDTNLAEQLVQACSVLRVLRTGDPAHIDASHTLSTALLMMLDNDGKNYAQLAQYGRIHGFLQAYLRTCMWLGRETNEGWPRDSPDNNAVLWLLWLTTERAHLLQESVEDREATILRILPFAILPQRYPASEAPPNHFHLPLPADHHTPVTATTATSSGGSSSINNSNNINNINNTPSGSTSPPQYYPHYLPPRATSQPYFGARILLTPPLASIPAKLLFVSRRELRPIVIPSHVPPGPGGPGLPLTRADYHELNRAKAAVLPRGACWDWESGGARGVNRGVRYVGDGDAGGVGGGYQEEEGEGEEGEEEESKMWDTTFWRMRLCGDYRGSRPRFDPGSVYSLGTMSGSWKGKIYIPQATQFNQALQNPIYPSVNDEHAAERGQLLFSEKSLRLVMQPVFLDVKEHHRVCACAGENASGTTRGRGREGEGRWRREKRGCGIIPVPEPQTMLLNPVPSRSYPQAHAQVHPQAHPQPQQQQPQNQPQQNPYTPSDPSTHPALPDAYKAFPSPQPQSVDVDMGMCNAWFEGAQGGVGWVKKFSVDAGGEDQNPTKRRRREEMVFSTGYTVPERMVKGGGCPGLGFAFGKGEGVGDANLEENAKTDANAKPKETKDIKEKKDRKSYVYETYDPERMSAHDFLAASASASSSLSTSALASASPHIHAHDGSSPSPSPSPSTPKLRPAHYVPSCAGCTAYERARTKQKKREDNEARRMLDGFMRDVSVSASGSGSGSGSGPGSAPMGVPMDVDEETQEMQDLDMDAFGVDDVVRCVERDVMGAGADDVSHDHDHDLNEEDEYDSDELESESESDSSDSDVDSDNDSDDNEIEVLGDDRPDGEPALVVYTCESGCEVGDAEGCRASVAASHSESDESDASEMSTDSTGSRKRKRTREGAASITTRSKRPRPRPLESLESTSSQAPSPSPSRAPSPSLSPSHPPKHKRTRTILPPTRREFDRSRIGLPCTGVKDIILTGETGSRFGIYQEFTCYGRVRTWDGMIGILRISRAPERGISYLFIFGYVLGERTFVGEWRMAASDPLRPAWGSAFVMSKT